jgi:multidrug efflux pump
VISSFFIDRPIFAWVVAIVIMLAGGMAIVTLPIAQYPTIAPPRIVITATYPGADAQTLENTVTQVIEQRMKGLDHVQYISSTSDGAGLATITITFDQSTNPDIAQVQVQNKLQQANALLPAPVLQQGLTVNKAGSSLLVVAVYSKSGTKTLTDLADFVASTLRDAINQVDGVGDTILFDSPYAMRIWLDPFKLGSFKLTTGDVKTALQAQNAQISAGQIGGLPHVAGQELNATVTAQARLRTSDEFADILLRTNPDGSTVHLHDVARVERGADDYSFSDRFNAHPGAGMAIQLAAGANALTTADAVKARINQLIQTSPDIGVSYVIDKTPFVRHSIEDVVRTLVIAIALVFLVMFLFLQDWRATLIPTIAVPVVLLGTFGILAVIGYSINTLTLFAMVLAIGLLVDDAIIVVENVKRIMSEEGLPPQQATRRSMREITGALIGIAAVLSAVFVPMAFSAGSVGVIYRQFSVTIVSVMVLSVIVAIAVTPALCATLLKVEAQHSHFARRGFFAWFNQRFEAMVQRYATMLASVLTRSVRLVVIYCVLMAATAFLYVRLPTSFLPVEDQGSLYVSYQLPPGAAIERTVEVAKAIEHHFLVDEKFAVDSVFMFPGFSFGGWSQNVGLGYVHLKDWSQRTDARNSSTAIAKRAMDVLSSVRNASVFVYPPSTVTGLGTASGFDMELQDQAGLGHQALMSARNQLLALAAKNPKLIAVRANGQDDMPQLKIEIDRTRAGTLGVSLADANDTLSTAWGGVYVDDYVDQGRVRRVHIKGDAAFRSRPEDLGHWFVRSAAGAMVPFSAFATPRWISGPPTLERFNGKAAVQILGSAAARVSSGAAMQEMEKLAATLPVGIGYEWTGLSYEERAAGMKAPVLYALSMLAVFLCLAALYESWSVPLSVILAVPLGIFGAVLAVTLCHLTNDIYFQIGLLTTIGLSAKNAILIVEFAQRRMMTGMPAMEAALEAARIRLRPILMTSLAFVAGVTPLAVSTGAGAGSQNDIGTGVIGGMLSATALAIFFIPLFFILVMKLFPATRGMKLSQAMPDPSPEGA